MAMAMAMANGDAMTANGYNTELYLLDLASRVASSTRLEGLAIPPLSRFFVRASKDTFLTPL
jgi:hypothetical protein